MRVMNLDVVRLETADGANAVTVQESVVPFEGGRTEPLRVTIVTPGGTVTVVTNHENETVVFVRATEGEPKHYRYGDGVHGLSTSALKHGDSFATD